MLQLSTLDLKTEIQEALETNVMLEADDGHGEVDAGQTDDNAGERQTKDSAGSDAEIPENLPVDADWNDIYAGSSSPASAKTSARPTPRQSVSTPAMPSMPSMKL